MSQDKPGVQQRVKAGWLLWEAEEKNADPESVTVSTYHWQREGVKRIPQLGVLSRKKMSAKGLRV